MGPSADHVLRRMASGLRHEMSNVLSGLSMGCQILQRSDSDLEVLSDFKSIERRLSSFRDRITLLTLPDKNRFAEVELRPFLREMAASCETDPVCEIELEDRAVNDRSLVGDRRAMTQLLSELLENAASAAGSNEPEGTIVLHRQDDPATISVRDKGSGFDDDLRKSAFDPFVTGSGKGHGLGLTIARQVVAGHGGTIWIPADTPCTTISCSLPENKEIE